MRRRTLREKVDQAYGRWLVCRDGDLATYVSKITGIPIDEVWDYILGRKA